MAVSLPALGRLVVPHNQLDAVTVVSLNPIETEEVFRSNCRWSLSCLRSLAGLRIAGPALRSPTKVPAR